MAHLSRVLGDGRWPLLRSARSRSWRSGFTLAETMVVLGIASILMLFSYPALMTILARYQVHSSAQQLRMLANQARYSSITLNQPVTLVADTRRHMFYAVSGVIAGMPPYNFPDGPGDIPGPQLVAAWQVPHDVSFAMQPATACVQGAFCQSFSFKSDGTGSGLPVIFSTPNQQSSTVVMKTPATGKMAIQ
jgi:prepilin-type N-terminal cleavage/methylation domain-containing protein